MIFAECIKRHVTFGDVLEFVVQSKREDLAFHRIAQNYVIHLGAGSDYRPRGWPRRVKVHDFADKTLGKVIPYGVYDVTGNSGWVKFPTMFHTRKSPSRRSPRLSLAVPPLAVRVRRG